MKEKIKNYKKVKGTTVFTGREQKTVSGDLEKNEIRSPVEITYNTNLRSTDFALKPRKKKSSSSLQQKVKTPSQSAGSHSLTALHYFKSSGR